jgi:hypothetical protein
MSRIGIPASARASVAALMHADLVPVIHMVMLQIWQSFLSTKSIISSK